MIKKKVQAKYYLYGFSNAKFVNESEILKVF